MAIVNVNFYSECLMRTVNFTAVIPLDQRTDDAGRKRGQKTPLRTLYLYHGIFGSEYDWLTGTRVKHWAMENNLAVIMPAGENKFYNDIAGTGEPFAKFVGEELIEFTRKVFPLSDRREDTYVAGLSMGGYGAIMTGLRYPETFGKIGAFSAALVGDQYKDKNDTRDFRRNLDFHTAVFGPEAEYEGGPNDSYALAKKVAEQGGPVPQIYMSCGYDDGLLPANQKYHEYLEKIGIPVDYFEDEGAHEWDFWGRHIKKFIDWLG